MKNIFKKIILLAFVFSLILIPTLTQAQLGPDDDPYAFENFQNGVGDPGANPNPTGGGGGGGGAGCNLAPNPKIQNVLTYMSCILNLSVIPLIFSLALVMFVYGVVQYVLNEADEGKREKGKQFMVWGIIALTVMVSVWGLVNLLAETFNIDTRIVPSVTPN